MKNRNATLRRWLVSLLLLALMAGLPLAGLAAQPPPDPIIDNDLDNEIGVDHPQNPGDVMLFKQATPVSGMVNVWDVVLRIEGRDQQKTSDIVLVIDTSGSMGDYGRMAAAKDAATSFVNTLLAPTAPSAANTQIAVVSFQSTVNTRQGLTNNQQDLHDAINRLNASGGTYTQAAVRRAEDILANSQADYKNIVLLSDGVPTYSYAMNNPGNYLNSQFIAEASSFDQYGRHYPNGNRQATTDNAPSSAYTTSRVGAGFAMFHRYYNPDGITNGRL